MQNEEPAQVFVQVVPVDTEREIGWGQSAAELLSSRLEDIRLAVAAGARAVAVSLEGLPVGEGWKLNTVSASFGVTLTAEAGVILSKASTGATFEVSVTYERAK